MFASSSHYFQLHIKSKGYLVIGKQLLPPYFLRLLLQALMPRLPTKLILKAYKENPLLVHLIKECRTLEHARNELRWLYEGAVAKVVNTGTSFRKLDSHYITRRWQQELRRMCTERGRGKPLQYILGDQPFGELEIICQKGVLIPRSVFCGISEHSSRSVAF